MTDSRPVRFFRSTLETLFDLATRFPLGALAVILALQTVFLIDARALWFSDEIRYANVFENFLNGHWLVLYLNGEFYPDKPPLFWWLIKAVHSFTGEVSPATFFTAVAISSFLFIAATYQLARRVGGFDRRTGLASGLVLLSAFYFVGVSHYLRMDLLFGALITASHICFYRALIRDRAPKLMISAFTLAAVATLTKGPLGFAFPLLAAVFFLAWSGRLKRFLTRDVLTGAVVGIAILLTWILAAFLLEENSFLHNIFYEQVYKRATDTWHHGQPFWHYFATLPLAWLPWTLLVFFLPAGRLLRASHWRTLFAGRRASENSGTAYLWILFLTGFLLLSAVSIKIVIYLLPLFAPMAVLSARALLTMPGEKVAGFFLAVAGLFALLGTVLPFTDLFTRWPVSISGLFPLALTALAVAGILWKAAPRHSAAPTLLCLVFGVTLWLQPLGLITAPSLDAVMSPKAQGELMGRYADAGYDPVAYKIYSGTYTFYAGRDILELKDLDETARFVESREKAVVGMRRKYWDQWENRPEALEIVHEQWIVDRPFVLAVKGGVLEP